MTSRVQTRPSPAPPPRLSPAAAEAAARSTVVVVDDEPANVAPARAPARDGRDRPRARLHRPAPALAHCAASLPDLVLLDLHMPQLDGFAVMEALQAPRARRQVPPGPRAHRGRHPRGEGAVARRRRQGLPQQALRPQRGAAARLQPARDPRPRRPARAAQRRAQDRARRARRAPSGRPPPSWSGATSASTGRCRPAGSPWSSSRSPTWPAARSWAPRRSRGSPASRPRPPDEWFAEADDIGRGGRAGARRDRRRARRARTGCRATPSWPSTRRRQRRPPRSSTPSSRAVPPSAW